MPDAAQGPAAKGTLTVSSLSAEVPDADVTGGISDLYVTISLLDVPNLDDDDDESTAPPDLRGMAPHDALAFCEKHRIVAQSSVVPNAANPVWQDEVLKLTLPAGTPRPPTVLVRLWDDDLTKRDEPLAAAEVPLEAGSGRVEKFPLPVAESRCVEEQAQPILISFDYEVALDAEARAAEDAQ